ncbi:MAG: hypothetical protein GY941_21205 [Planctomycetes bacterium]|nr:hypothetical protein [Planctomycetota bacterium]
MITPLKVAVQKLYNDLDGYADEFEELTDTDVRDSLLLILNYYFVWGKKTDTFPISFGMFSYEGDMKIKRSVEKFLKDVSENQELDTIPTGKARLDILQDASIQTSNGYQFDEFIGFSEQPLSPESLPQDLFEEEDYDD